MRRRCGAASALRADLRTRARAPLRYARARIRSRDAVCGRVTVVRGELGYGAVEGSLRSRNPEHKVSEQKTKKEERLIEKAYDVVRDVHTTQRVRCGPHCVRVLHGCREGRRLTERREDEAAAYGTVVVAVGDRAVAARPKSVDQDRNDGRLIEDNIRREDLARRRRSPAMILICRVVARDSWARSMKIEMVL